LTTRLRAVSRGSLLLAAAMVVVVIAVVSNIPESVSQHHLRQRDKQVLLAWVATHGGRRAYGVGVTETHSRNDIICTPHFTSTHPRRADYRLYLLVDSHGSGPARVIRAARGPLKVKPTATGAKCGNMPPP
jgi:hypothetical protein